MEPQPTPTPTPETPSQGESLDQKAPEAQPAAPEVTAGPAGSGAPTAPAASAAGTPPPPPPAGQSAAPAVTPMTQPTPPGAEDVDLIEKEWVDAAEKVVEATADDPHKQEEAVELLQVDYLKKRYGKEIKKPEGS